MSESIKKIEHADFIALMSKDQVKDDEVHLKVTKNKKKHCELAHSKNASSALEGKVIRHNKGKLLLFIW